MSNVYRESPDFDKVRYAIEVMEWEDGEENNLGFGPFATAEAAHKFAAQRIPFTDYTLLTMISPSAKVQPVSEGEK